MFFFSLTLIAVFFRLTVSCELEYKVRKNDTCLSICRKNHIILAEFLKINDKIDCKNLTENSVLCVADSNRKPAFETNCLKTTTVESGYSCENLWLENRLSEYYFKYLNPDINCNNLQISEKVCIMGKQTSCNQYLKVKNGDTCQLISNTYGIDIDSLQVNNPGVNCNQIIDNQDICVLIPLPDCILYYNYKPNDTLSHVLQNLKLSLKDIYALNPYFKADSISSSQPICVNGIKNEVNLEQNISNKLKLNFAIAILIISIFISIPILLSILAIR